MRNRLLASIVLASTLSSTANADMTVGLGLGTLYSGIGLNFGTTTDTSLRYASLGCLGISLGNTDIDSSDSTERTQGDSSNCGVGVGYVTTSVLSGKRQGLGLSLLATNNTVYKNNDGSNLEVTVIPGYYFFFNGIDRSGFNIGAGANFGFREGQSVETGMTLNVGYQF